MFLVIIYSIISHAFVTQTIRDISFGLSVSIYTPQFALLSLSQSFASYLSTIARLPELYSESKLRAACTSICNRNISPESLFVSCQWFQTASDQASDRIQSLNRSWHWAGSTQRPANLLT